MTSLSSSPGAATTGTMAMAEQRARSGENFGFSGPVLALVGGLESSLFRTGQTIRNHRPDTESVFGYFWNLPVHGTSARPCLYSRTDGFETPLPLAWSSQNEDSNDRTSISAGPEGIWRPTLIIIPNWTWWKSSGWKTPFRSTNWLPFRAEHDGIWMRIAPNPFLPATGWSVDTFLKPTMRSIAYHHQPFS